MARFLLSMTVIALASLACTQVVATPTPPPTAQPASPTPTATSVPVTVIPTQTQDVQTTMIRATVYIRAEPDANSAAVGSLVTGERVVIVRCESDWCEIDGGWIWRGCTDNNPNNLLCEARP